ncbi:MAG TPA: Verru_Chthon cassette protein D [Chthoniobacteraceae bacterium]|nr:Verru_Chthon cassette protein D [Chthoniobacteraceae bacterium]
MITPNYSTGRRARALVRRGFTLVELLLVMAVMLVIMGLVVGSFNSFSKAGNLSAGAQNFVDTLNEARQYALAMNRNVEVRFYYLPGPTDGTTATAYRAMRVIVCDASGNTSSNNGTSTVYNTGAIANPVVRLPAGVIIYSSTKAGSSGTYFTTLVPAMTGAGPSSAPTAVWPGSVTTSLRGTYGIEYFPGNTNPIPVAYAAFQFKPSGGTNLDPLGTGGSSAASSDKWFVSLIRADDQPDPSNQRPTLNFVTVVVDPASGRVRTYRPGS